MTGSASRLGALVAELQRRRVLKVSAVYLLGMWLIIQVADITFTRLGLPDWTVTFVIVAGALLFPVVVALAWVFDLGRGGLTRTPDQSDVLAAHSGARPTPTGRRYRRQVVAMAAVMAIPLLGFGLWWTGMRGARGANLDDDLVTVTPFRVAGASADLGYLREGLMDLIAARIATAGEALEVVPPRNVSRRIRETLGSLDADPDRDEARRIAIGFGAGLLLEGEVVGTDEGFTVTARLVDVRTGYRRDDVEITSHPDSLHGLVDRIAARLVAAESGLGGARLAALTTTSLPALRAFLEGEQAFRRGDHGRAVRAYDQAVSLDSTFAMAALGLIRARGWAFTVEAENSGRAEALVRRRLDRLSEVDRLYFNASFGRDGPESLRELVEGRISAAERMPDVPELQYLAGDGIFHYGLALGMAESESTAVAYFERTVAMDSSFTEALIHLHGLAFSRADTAGVHRWGRMLLAVDTSGPLATSVHHTDQRLGRATPGVPPIDVDTLDFDRFVGATMVDWFGPPHPGLLDGLVRHLEEAPTAEERLRVAGFLEYFAVQAGRPTDLARTSAFSITGLYADVVRLALALYWHREAAEVRAAAAEVEEHLAAARAAVPPGRPVVGAVTHRECILGHRSVATRDVADVQARAAVLEGAVHPDRDAWTITYDRVCAAFLRAAAAVEQGAPDARTRMAALHDSLGMGQRRPAILYPTYDLATAELWERLGEPELALEAVRRRVHLPGYDYFHVELMGEQARLAEQLGRREEAIDRYRSYIGQREDAEGVFAERAARAREALARLLGRG